MAVTCSAADASSVTADMRYPEKARLVTATPILVMKSCLLIVVDYPLGIVRVASAQKAPVFGINDNVLPLLSQHENDN